MESQAGTVASHLAGQASLHAALSRVEAGRSRVKLPRGLGMGAPLKVSLTECFIQEAV